jgi:hypothetical protein
MICRWKSTVLLFLHFVQIPPDRLNDMPLKVNGAAGSAFRADSTRPVE